MFFKDDFQSCWGRVKYLTEWKHLIELSRFLGVSSGTVSKAKERNDFPAEWAVVIAVKFNSFSEWILFGRGDARFSGDPEVHWPDFLARGERGYLLAQPQLCSPAFGQTLKALRLKHRLSLSEAAAIGNQTIYDYLDFERGFRPMPNVMRAYAVKFEVNERELFNGTLDAVGP